ncbi:MAG: hypothetical protein WA919_12280, partial [Coleofasciculaceae cyanobacterium]
QRTHTIFRRITMLQVTAIQHKNSVVLAVFIAILLTVVEHLDTLSVHLVEASVLVIGAKVLLTLWRGVGESTVREDSSSEVTQEVPLEVAEVEPPTMQETTNEASEEFSNEAQREEETVITDTSEPVVKETELDATSVAPEQKALVATSEEKTPGVSEVKPLLKGFSPRPMWKRLCQHLRDREHLSVDGYSKISSAEKRAAFLVQHGVTIRMMQQARLRILNTHVQ